MIIAPDEIGPEKLWGAAQIAKALSVSPDFVYKLSKVPGVPIYKPPGAGMLFAFRSELRAWLRTKPTLAKANPPQPNGQTQRRRRKA